MSTRQQAVDELSIRGQYMGVQLGSHPIPREELQNPGDNSITGVNSTQNSEMTKPPRPVQPAPNGHEIPVLEEPELPTSTSADVMEPAGADEGTRRSKWDWIQGVFSIGKKEEGASVDEAAAAVIANEARQSEKSGKENIAEVQAPVAGVVSREPPSVAASAELQKGKTDAEVPGFASQVNEARETVSGVVDKMPRAVSVESKDSKSVPGVWIKSVWGTRQEVDDLDLAIQQALELEHIDCSKYFTRDYTEFPSVAHYYVQINDALDEEEVDLLASFAGRMGENHPLVQAMMEIMEEDGTQDGSIVMDTEASGQPLKARSAEVGVYISDSGRLRVPSEIHRPPSNFSQGANAAVRVSTQRSLAAASDETAVTSKTAYMANGGGSKEEEPSPAAPTRPPRARRTADDEHDETTERRMPRGKQPLVPGMDELVNELSAFSWLSRKGPLKPREDASVKVVKPEQESKGSTQSPVVPPPNVRPPTQTSVPRQAPQPVSKATPQRSTGLHTESIATQQRNSDATHGAHSHTAYGPTAQAQKRGLLDIMCCLRPRAESA